MISNATRACIILIWYLSMVLCEGEFKGKVSGFGYEVQALPGGGSISVKPPQTEIEDNSGGKVDYAKTEAVPLIPPFVDNVLSMAEALNPKLDVKGKYNNWTPKIRVIKPNRKINLIKMHAPKLLPMPKIIAQRRGKLSIRQPAPRGKDTHRKYNVGSPISQKNIHLEGHDAMTMGVVQYHLKPNTIGSYQILPGYYRHNYGKRLFKREVTSKKDLQKSIEAIISNSFKTNENEKSNIISRRKDVDASIMKTGTKGNSKMMRYVDGMKSKVHHVVAEAKAVLEDTGKVVHGLKKVISGAKRLTEFTNNAVTFAKYFAREPTNATVDFFEEKAVIAVLESQKAAADAKIAAVVAREAARKVKLIAKRIRGKNKSFDKKLSKAVKYAEGQAHRAEQAARISSFKEKDARKDAIIADKALRKMIKLANEKKEAEKEEETKKEPEDIHSKEQENGYEGSGESESEEEAEKLTNNENENVKQKEEPSVIIKEQKNKQLSEGDGTESNSTRKESIKEKLEQGENGNKTERLKETKTNEETVDSSSNTVSLKNISKWILSVNKSSEKQENLKHDQKIMTDSGHDNKSGRLEDTELPGLFEAGEDENEVLSNDFDKSKGTFLGYSLPKEAVNGSDVNESEDSKNAEGEISKNSEKQSSIKDKTSPIANAGNLKSNNSRKDVSEDKSTPAEQKHESKILEREVKKVSKGPVDLVVTVTRRKQDRAMSGLTSPSTGKGKQKTINITSYDPFNFKSLESAENSKKASHYIVDKEDQGRIGLSPVHDVKEYNSIRSFIPKMKRPRTLVSSRYFPERLQKSRIMPTFYLNSRNGYTSVKKTQRSFVPYRPYRNYKYDTLLPSYYWA